MIIAGFPGIGKTSLSGKYNNIIDLDETRFVFLNLTEEDKKQGYLRKYDEDYPMNYYNIIMEMTRRYDAVLIGQSKILDVLNEKSIDYILVYPEEHLKQEYLDRYRQRGDSENYLSIMDANWNYYITELDKDRHKKIVMTTGKYLIDYIQELGLEGK